MLDHHRVRIRLGFGDGSGGALFNRGRHRWAALRTTLAIFVVAIASCAHTADDNQKGTGSGRFTLPRGSDQVMIEVSSVGGLVLPVVRVDDSLPRVWISGDGRYLRQSATGADTPALVAMEERRIPEAALQNLLTEASNAGLLADSPDYGTPKIFDAVNTRILLVADARRHDVLVRALGYPVAGLDAATVAARERVSRFIDLLEHPERITGVGTPSPYPPTGVAVFVLGPAAASATKPAAMWPVGDLATAGTPTNWPAASARCFVVTDADLRAVTAAASGTSRTAPWRSGDALWEIAMRPLLPDEHTCADVVG